MNGELFLAIGDCNDERWDSLWLYDDDERLTINGERGTRNERTAALYDNDD